MGVRCQVRGWGWGKGLPDAVVAVWLVLLTLPDVDCGGREGRDSVLLASAIAAANAVFPDTQPALSYDRVRLTGGKGPAHLPCALLLTALSCQTSFWEGADWRYCTPVCDRHASDHR